MAQTQILESIYAIMQINNVAINDLNIYYKQKIAEKQATKPAEKQVTKPAEKQATKPAEKQVTKPAEKQATKPAEKQIKWGDEAVDLDEDNKNTTEKSSWISVIKKETTPQKDVKTTTKPVTKPSNKKEEEDTREVIYTVKEFIQCIKEKKKLHIDFKIHQSGHCQHTFNGTLCDNVKECGMIHIQRCINNLDCKYKNCQFLHADDMPDEEAYENYMYTMDEYNKIKKNKKVYV